VTDNVRQVLTVGIKESKGIVASRHRPTHHPPEIARSQELVLFAQNFHRWFHRQVMGRSAAVTVGIKALIHGGAKSRAVLAPTTHGLNLTFGPDRRWRDGAFALRARFSSHLPHPGFNPSLEVPP
jgi:hypothetical protein